MICPICGREMQIEKEDEKSVCYRCRCGYNACYTKSRDNKETYTTCYGVTGYSYQIACEGEKKK